MTHKQIADWIEYIKSVSADNEAAHCEEDDLMIEFIASIADGKYKTLTEIVTKAKAVIKVRDIDFDRWHA